LSCSPTPTPPGYPRPDFAALPERSSPRRWCSANLPRPAGAGRRHPRWARYRRHAWRGRYGRDRPRTRGLTRAVARLAASYQPGDIIAHRRSDRGRPRVGMSYKVESADAERCTMRLVPDKGKAHDWKPAGAPRRPRRSSKSSRSFAKGRVQFTRNNYRADRDNGDTAEVVAIDPQGTSMVAEREDGRRDMLDLRHLVRSGCVRTSTPRRRDV